MLHTHRQFRISATRHCVTLLMVLAGALFGARPTQAQSLVTLDTGALNGQGTFYLDFQLLDGSGMGDGNSVVTLSGLSLTGGNLGAALPSSGTVSGDPAQPTGLTLKDSDPIGLAEYIQPFTVTGPTSQLTFTVNLTTTSPLDTPIPDVFNFLVLESDGVTPLPTQGPTGVELLSSDFTSSRPSLTSYGTVEPSPVVLTAPTVQPMGAAVPEPSAGVLSLWGGLTLALALRRRTR